MRAATRTRGPSRLRMTSSRCWTGRTPGEGQEEQRGGVRRIVGPCTAWWPLRADCVQRRSLPCPVSSHAFLFYLSWAGYFTSRAALKGYIRQSGFLFQAAKQLQAFTGAWRRGRFRRCGSRRRATRRVAALAAIRPSSASALPTPPPPPLRSSRHRRRHGHGPHQPAVRAGARHGRDAAPRRRRRHGAAARECAARWSEAGRGGASSPAPRERAACSYLVWSPLPPTHPPTH